jgi:ABC-type maltose transport system permease subunit
MLGGYLDSIPGDLDEAALVDGNGPLGALFRVVVPAGAVKWPRTAVSVGCADSEPAARQ